MALLCRTRRPIVCCADLAMTSPTREAKVATLRLPGDDVAFLAVMAFSIVIFGLVALAVGHVHWARVHNRRAAGLVTAGGVVAFIVVGLLLPKNPATGTAASVTSNVLSSSPRAVASLTRPPAVSETSQDAATTLQTQPAESPAPTPSDPSHTTGTFALPTSPLGPVAVRTSAPRPVAARATQPATQPPPAPANPPATAAPRSVAAAPPTQPATQAPPPAPANPPAAAPAATCHPLTNGGNCYEPGEYCRNADHGARGVAGNGEAIVCNDNNGWRWEPA